MSHDFAVINLSPAVTGEQLARLVQAVVGADRYVELVNGVEYDTRLRRPHFQIGVRAERKGQLGFLVQPSLGSEYIGEKQVYEQVIVRPYPVGTPLLVEYVSTRLQALKEAQALADTIGSAYALVLEGLTTQLEELEARIA